jgi:outer membrane protein assembly factor BamB
MPPRSRPRSRSSGGRHARKAPFPFGTLVLVLIVLIGAAVVWKTDVLGEIFGGSSKGKQHRGAGSPQPASPSVTESTAPGDRSPTPGQSHTPKPAVSTPGPINTKFPGLTTFRGNATRSYYGEGPVPKHPVVLWQYPTDSALCGTSSASGITKQWCGTGWTGQPNVIQHDDGTIEVREGAYDYHYHFLDGLTGEHVHPDFITGDLAKGSATSDPDGFPLYYGGSRDNFLRVIALDRPQPTQLWSVNSETSVPNPIWNSDWDGAPLIVGDYLLEGGENSWFYVIRLNRHYDSKGLVQVDPKIVMTVPGWDDQLLRDLPDDEISIENSVAFDADRGVVYFSNSGGLVQGWDISDILKGGTHYERVFRFWDGDDTDATVVLDEEGDLYVGVEYQRKNARDAQVGQIIKLDPSKPDDPLVWSVDATQIGFEDAGGTWGTPALYGNMVFDTTAAGHLLGIDKRTGKVWWSLDITPPSIASPVPIDDTLIVGDCGGVLHAFDISKPHKMPKERWHLQLPGCIESTPAVWHGMLWLGTRAGRFYAIGDK